MRHLLISAIFCFLSILAQSQCPTGPAQQINAYYEYLYTKFRHLLQIPRHAPGSSCRDTADVYYNPADTALHWWTGKTDQTFLYHANQGAYDSSHTVQLGEPLGQSGNPSRFNQHREVPLNNRKLVLWDTLNNSVDSNYQSFEDTTSDYQGNIFKVPYTIAGKEQGRQLYEFKPYNYGVVYATGYRPSGFQKACDFTSGLAPGSGGGDAMPDNVYGWGYNIKNGTARKDTMDGGVNFAIESNFLNTLDIVQPNFEVHCPRVYTWDGTEIRASSYYVGKKTGYALHEQVIADEQFKDIRQVGAPVWLQFFNDNGGITSSIVMTGTQTPGVTFDNKLIMRSSDGTENSIWADAFAMYFGSSNTNHRFSQQFLRNGDVKMCQSASGDPTTWPRMRVGMDSTTSVTDPSAQLQVVSDRRGFLPPQMTSAQRTAIVSPAEGLMVYDLDIHSMFYWNGTVWVNF